MTTPRPYGRVGDAHHWTPLFHDEFEGTELDLSKWQYDPNPLNGSTSRPSAGNVAVKDGKLTLLLTDRHGARLNTRDRFSFYTALVEFRVRRPSHQHSWGALWTMADPWPQAGEVDVMECGMPDASQIEGHWHGPNGAIPTYRDSCAWDFRHFAAWRRKDEVRWYFQGEEIGRLGTDTGHYQHWLCMDLMTWGSGSIFDHMTVDHVRVWG